ncbi:MAG: hypothetical protein JNN08_18180 [Bryobacterales bacterium]|nr:hypothetical protein [Bryobacterales bacterium]
MKNYTLMLMAAGLLWMAGCNRTPVAADGAASVEGAASAESPRTVAAKSAAATVKSPEPPAAVELPVGTRLRVRTGSTISTKTAEPGDQFVGTLEEPLIVGGTVVAAKGADVAMRVVNADPGGKVKGRATVTVRPTQVRGAHGEMIDLATDAHTRIAPASKKKDAVKVGIASGVGAAIGAIAGGGKGAAIGAGAGAGAGSGYVLATRGEPAVIPAETLISFRTTAPVLIESRF